MYGVALAATRLGQVTGTVLGYLAAIASILSSRAWKALLNYKV